MTENLKLKGPGKLTMLSRIPTEYVVVHGAGQSNFGPGDDPWETTAYDIALQQADICNCNIVKYTSVLPPEARQISMEEAQAEGLFHHGMVLECIMAQVNGNQYDALCAGVGTFQVYHQDREGASKHVGGFAVEYEGGGSEDFAKKMLKRSMDGLFERRYGHYTREFAETGQTIGYYMKDETFHTQSLIVDDKFGTVLVALGFVKFILPVI